jgi:hypothetical protein
MESAIRAIVWIAVAICSAITATSISTVLVVGVALGQQSSPESSHRGNSVIPYASIFMAEIVQAHASKWEPEMGPQHRSVTVRARVTRVLKDESHQRLAPGVKTRPSVPLICLVIADGAF